MHLYVYNRYIETCTYINQNASPYLKVFVRYVNLGNYRWQKFQDGTKDLHSNIAAAAFFDQLQKVP